MFCNQNLGEARFNDLCRNLLLLRLLKSSINFILHFPFSFFNLLFLNFGLICTCSFFLQWKLHILKFSIWNKKSSPNIISSYFRLTHNGNQPLLILASTVIICVSIPAFVSLVGILVGIGSSAATKKNCAITAGIKKYKSIMKKRKKKMIR